MLEISRLAFMAATPVLLVALVAYVGVLFIKNRTPHPARVPVGAGAPMEGSADVPVTPAKASGHGVGWFASRLSEAALVLLTIGLITRTLATGHAPFANQYEFAVAFVWGIMAAYVFFEWRYQVKALALVALPVAIVGLLYAATREAEAKPLVPALQNHLLLTVHVITAVLAYGAAAVGFAAAGLYLTRSLLEKSPALKAKLPADDVLEEIAYRSIVVSFPLMTIMIILGAVWADIAWGRYWSWDPKETAALVTWLIYGAYLHARVVRDWRGKRAAWLLMLGFVAVVFTFLGNQFFGGLHAYA